MANSVAPGQTASDIDFTGQKPIGPDKEILFA